MLAEMEGGGDRVMRLLTPRKTVLVLYGLIGTKSLAIIVISCPSIEKNCCPAAPALISLSRCDFPFWNLNFDIGASFLQGVLSFADEQLKTIFPLMRLLSEYVRHKLWLVLSTFRSQLVMDGTAIN